MRQRKYGNILTGIDIYRRIQKTTNKARTKKKVSSVSPHSAITVHYKNSQYKARKRALYTITTIYIYMHTYIYI